MLNEQPAYGSTVSYTIAEGTFCDIFGNVNNEFTAEEEYYYSYGYTLADILGSYEVNATSYWYGPTTTTLTIAAYTPAEEDDPKGNVAITEYAGIKCDYPIVGTFDVDAGLLTFAGGQVFADAIPDYVYDEDGNPVVGEDGKYLITTFMGVFMTNSSDGTSPVTFNVFEAGKISNPSIWVGLYGVWADDEGWYDMFTKIDAVRKEQPSASSSSLKRTGRKSF
jgi:hypothetical protein